jgi:hypothetical protein
MYVATEKAAGMCHLGIGQSAWLGSDNECSIPLDFLTDDPTVTVNGRSVLKNLRSLI